MLFVKAMIIAAGLVIGIIATILILMCGYAAIEFIYEKIQFEKRKRAIIKAAKEKDGVKGR